VTYEIEVKLIGDHGDVRPRLVEAGYRRSETVEQRDRYFGHPSRPFAATDEALRLRTTREVSSTERTLDLTYKGPRLSNASKARIELDCRVEGEASMSAILEELDFEEVGTIEKTRDVFRRDDTAVALDTVVGLGEFVEIERTRPSESVEHAEEQLYYEMDELGLPRDAVVERTYLELLFDDS